MSSQMLEEMKVLYHIVLARNRGRNHAERMEAYFGPQAAGYDRFRQRLLQGRRALYEKLPAPEGGIWLEMGCGTGQCMEYLGDRIHRLGKVYLIDVSPSLLAKAQERVDRCHWRNAECCLLDAATDPLPVRQADVATFCYALTMIPDWFKAIENVRSTMAAGGTLGVCDFHLARKHPAMSQPSQSLLSRVFWQLFFHGDDVFPNADHLPYLQSRFATVENAFGKARIPYLPLWAPWYRFIGRIPGGEA